MWKIVLNVEQSPLLETEGRHRKSGEFKSGFILGQINPWGRW